MNKTAKLNSMRKTGLVIGITLVITLFTGKAVSQEIVEDPVAIGHLIEQYARQAEQFAKQIAQYENQLLQYQQMLSSIQGLFTGMSITPNKLQKITVSDSDSLIQANCAGDSGSESIVGSVINSLTSLFSQSITKSQQQICAQIVLTQVDRYNQTVTMLDKLNNYGGMFQKVEKIAQSISTIADTGRASNQVQQYSSAVQTEMADWQALMHADDSIIASLENQQSILGRIALKGRSTPLGNVIEAAAFAAAFH